MQRPLQERAVLNLYVGGKLVFTGNVFDVREHIEWLLEEKLGFFVTLQEMFDTEDQVYFIYLHTDIYDDLEDEQLDQVFELGISEDDIASTNAIKSLLNLEIEFSHYSSE